MRFSPRSATAPSDDVSVALCAFIGGRLGGAVSALISR